jgi:xylulokinase
VEEGPAFGAALLAGVGTSAYASVPEACAATLKTNSETRPHAETAAVYSRYYPLYRSLYPALRPAFQEVASLAQES